MARLVDVLEEFRQADAKVDSTEMAKKVRELRDELGVLRKENEQCEAA